MIRSHLNEFGLGMRLTNLRRQISSLVSDGAVTDSVAIQELQDEIDDLSAYIADSRQLDSFRCFMVDFLGVGGVDVIEDQDVADLAAGLAINKKLPTLYSVVEAWINEEGAKLTDKSYGLSSWCLGAHCAPGEAWMLTKRANKHFEKALKAGLLQIRIQPWSMDYTG
jgi:hypothetical protein